ncbi:hypothetical protein ERJ75_001746500 [Trypanosoma vivax]|nr:hypothetical protein ERJ75_001746500 [Trypanosoma vivax]
MRMARSTKAQHAAEMKMPSTRRSTFRPITEAGLGVALRELSSGTAPGTDEIHCEELKQLGRASRRHILRLFNYSLRAGKVPAKWRQGIIVPLLKPNKPANSMASFRPVTLTSTLCKLMERIVARGVRDWIEDNLQPQRAGFRPARSTLDTLMQGRVLCDEGRMARRRRLCSLTVRVPSIQLITVALSSSFCPLAWKGIWCVDRGFLQEHTAQVRVNNIVSEDMRLTCGVPQGSVLDHCCSLSRRIR